MASKGRFGKYGGQYVPEIVMPVLNQLEEAYNKYKDDPDFLADLRKYYVEYAGRPTLLYYADKLTRHYGGEVIGIPCVAVKCVDIRKNTSGEGDLLDSN